ncbi:hypothetical protein EJB05_20667, partial [Eragrostis curvula]
MRRLPFLCFSLIVSAEHNRWEVLFCLCSNHTREREGLCQRKEQGGRREGLKDRDLKDRDLVQ